MIKRYPEFLTAFAIFCCFLFPGKTNAQSFFRLDSVNREIKLVSHWKFKQGDNKTWANSSFDDKDWDTGSLNRLEQLEESGKIKGISWLRLHLKVSPALFHKTILFRVQQSGASQIYLNNNLVESFGKVGDSVTEIPYNPFHNVYLVQLGGDTMQLLAVRYSENKIMKSGSSGFFSFNIQLEPISDINDLVSKPQIYVNLSFLIFGIFLTLSIFHLLIFVYYRKVLSNLYYSIFALFCSLIALSFFSIFTTHNPLYQLDLVEMDGGLVAPCFFLIIVLLYSIFQKKFNWFFWTLLCITVLALGMYILDMPFVGIVLMFVQIIASCISGIIIIIKALRKKQQGAWIIASGFLVFLGMIPAILLFFAVGQIFSDAQHLNINSGVIMVIWVFSIPVSMSVYLASDFARTNKKLSVQLVHVKQLSEQNIEKEKEKQQIIKQQKEMLEMQVKEKTSEIEKQKNQLVQKNTEITDSILYARRIQAAVLPPDEMLKEALGNYLVIFMPKDVVSGDFYWCYVNGDIVVFAVADCTGHGVPGGFMSMIGNSLLNEVVMDRKVFEADVILNELRTKLISTLQKSGGHNTTRDGMDIALCVWNKKDNTLQYAGANNPLYRISENIALDASVQQSEKIKVFNSHLIEMVADKQPVGYQEDKMNTSFTRQVIQLRKGDTIYITSDGFIDQFGGDNDKKFTSKRLRHILDTFVHMPIEDQRLSLVQAFEDWKKDGTQTDDICVLGVKI